jgi:hypothetical protein
MKRVTPMAHTSAFFIEYGYYMHSAIEQHSGGKKVYVPSIEVVRSVGAGQKGSVSGN